MKRAAAQQKAPAIDTITYGCHRFRRDVIGQAARLYR
jgi:hypothetical protein